MSQLHDRLASLAVAVAVTFIFTCLHWLVPKIGHLSLPQTVGVYALNALVSAAIYKTIASSLLWSFKKNLLLRKLFLGKSFLEGSWVGHHKNNGQERFTFEVIDQSEGLTRINGRELTRDGETTATWTSDAVSVDSQQKRLVYAYSCDVFETSRGHRGIGSFEIRCESNKYPDILDGYAADLTNGKKDANREHKINDRTIPANEALKEARRIFDSLNPGIRVDART
jgi:hypothetical protein